MSWPLLSHPAMTLWGEWGPLWTVSAGIALCFSVRPAVAFLSSLLWLLEAEGRGSPASNHFLTRCFAVHECSGQWGFVYPQSAF